MGDHGQLPIRVIGGSYLLSQQSVSVTLSESDAFPIHTVCERYALPPMIHQRLLVRLNDAVELKAKFDLRIKLKAQKLR